MVPSTPTPFAPETRRSFAPGPGGRHASQSARPGRRRRRPRGWLAVAVLCLGLALSPGCATWVAVSMPGPAQDDQIQVEMSRSEVETVLAQTPTSMYENKGMTEARYEYSDGPPEWSKLRALVYVAGDVFTLFLSELIFWPIELTAESRIQRIAVAEYSDDNKLASWTIRRKTGGEVLRAEQSPSYDTYVAAARRPAVSARPAFAGAAEGAGPAARRPVASQQAIFAPSSVTTQREVAEFEVVIRDTRVHAELLVNGRAVEPRPDGTVVVRERVPMGTSSVLLSAIDDSGGGFVQRVEVTRSAPNAKAPSSLRLGRYHALVIGNDAYTALQPLRTARADAQAMAGLLRDKYGYEVDLLLDASRSEIVSAVAGYKSRLTRDDNLLIYYAGHGIREESEDHGYWLPVDARPDDPSAWIANANITRQLKAMDARHVMVIADSCFSGTLTRGIVVPDRAPGYLTRLAERRSRTALTSGGVEPVADMGTGGKNSVFAEALLQELRANEGLLEANDLFSKLRRRVALNSDQTPQYAPIVKADHKDGEFLFVAR